MADPKKGTGKKPKGSGRRLYTDENPKDTVRIKFATPTDARKTVAKVKKVKKPFATWTLFSDLKVVYQRKNMQCKKEILFENFSTCKVSVKEVLSRYP